MNDLYAAALQQFGAALPLALMVHLRLLGCLVALPGFGERAVPVRLRVALGIALTPVFLQLNLPDPPTDASRMLVLGAAELVIGLILGVTVRLTAASLSMAASTIASTASLAQLIGGQNEMAPHPVGNMLHLAGLAVLMAMGFPIMVTDYLGAAFAAWPPGQVPSIAGLAPAFVALMGRAFSLSLVLASPFILGGLLYQALGGVVGRTMPALPVVFIGAPLAILLALAGLVLFAQPMLAVWADAVLSTVLPVPGP